MPQTAAFLAVILARLAAHQMASDPISTLDLLLHEFISASRLPYSAAAAAAAEAVAVSISTRC